MRFALLLIVAGLAAGPVRAQDPPDQSLQQPAQQSAQQPAHQTSDIRDPVWYPGDTEGVKPLTYKLGVNVLLDQRDIWTSPFRMHKKDAPWWLGFGAVTAALIVTDNHTSTVFENSKEQVSWGNTISNIGASYTVLPLDAGFYTYGVLMDDPKAREVGILGGEALLDSLIVQEVLKPIAGRNRPDNPHKAGDFFQGGASFPSGHAMEVWSFAAVLGDEYGHTKVVPIVGYTLATAVSLARFAAQKHYASDIVAGGAMGWFIGRFVYKTHMDHAIHPHQRIPRPTVVPQLNPAVRQYAVALQFGGS